MERTNGEFRVDRHEEAPATRGAGGGLVQRSVRDAGGGDARLFDPEDHRVNHPDTDGITVDLGG